jgi:hypothetical protein
MLRSRFGSSTWATSARVRVILDVDGSGWSSAVHTGRRRFILIVNGSSCSSPRSSCWSAAAFGAANVCPRAGRASRTSENRSVFCGVRLRSSRAKPMQAVDAPCPERIPPVRIGRPACTDQGARGHVARIGGTSVARGGPHGQEDGRSLSKPDYNII